ncbi:unnamed protein product [Phytophthora fragariaefolia]|uniref:phosphoglycerate kinase n=1 Tax=Phytophthora fragariaefolia TaxID=1490495 RepID=A0A9W6Y8B1_9STRA|nr:unnamed protein product [Phytophthora fragariaefolia]
MDASAAETGAKPSSAGSASSPSGRKTRTILVARAVADEPTTAPRAAGGSASVVNQRHSRDARSGKLAAYAALGGEEDVERFDQFLAEQRGPASASELRAAAASPQHVLASMKRKTMSRIQLDGVGASEQAAGEEQAARTFVQQEMATDARKRREQAVAHRKWLNALPIHERVAQRRQQNALRKWRQMNRDWETFKARAARRLGKTPQELVMSRAAAYREQREMYDALQKARPLSDKVGGDIWLVSLRNEGTRFVPVGNIFSGLFCPIRESTKLGPSVRRPLDYHDNQREREHEASRPLSKLEKRSLDLLARKKWRLRKQLQVLQPHEVERSASSHLAVGTTDLFAWASGAMEDTNSDEGSIRGYSAGSENGHSRRRRLRSYASPSSPKSVKKVGPNDQSIGPSLRIRHVADDESAATPESSASIHDLEPCRPPLRLSFYASVGEQEQRSLMLTNDGSTIIHYQWWRAPFEDENAALTVHLRGRRTRREEQERQCSTTTSISKLGGTLLPGEIQQLVFSFESSQSGVFLEKWLLDADPKPRITFGMGTDVDNGMSSVDLPIEVRLSCVAEDNFAAWRQRQMQLTRVEERASQFFVANLVDEILNRVKPLEPVVFVELTPSADVDKFYEANDATEFSDVYFSPELVRACYELFERSQHILRTLLSVQEPFAQEEGGVQDRVEHTDFDKSNGISSEASPMASPEQPNSDLNTEVEADVLQEITNPSSLPVLLSQEWNWRLETLHRLCKDADEAQRAEISRLMQQLKKVVEEVEDDDEIEEDDENDEGDEDDEDDEDNNEEGGEGNDGDEKSEECEGDEVGTSKSKRINPREQRKNERLVRRKALEDEINSLNPNLQEVFDLIRFTSYTAPYSSARFQERLYERIGTLCSETPVVCEIAMATNAVGAYSADIAKLKSVRSLLTRAIDEAVGGDHDHQAMFEQKRRKLQKMWLNDKASYVSIGQWMAMPPSSTTEIPSGLSVADSIDTPAPQNNPETIDNSGVLLFQVDLDLASWFSLVKVDNKADGTPNEFPQKNELSWRFSQELVQHPNFVPKKIVKAGESLMKVLDALPNTNPLVHTVVLVSELSRPPLTKPMQKLLRNTARAELKVNSARTSQIGTGTEEKKYREGDDNEEAEITMMESFLLRLASQLSLRSVAQVMQRAIQKDVVFCSGAEEVLGQIEFARKELLLNSSVPLGGIENTVLDKETEGDSEVPKITPRILLLEHLDVAGADLVTNATRQRELASSKPATPVLPESQKTTVGAGKKTSVTAKGKPGTPGAPVAPTPTPTPEVPPSSSLDLTKLDFAGKDLSEQRTSALRSLFTHMASICILDGIPSTAYEGLFTFESKKNRPALLPLTLAGPSLDKELKLWSRMLQPALSASSYGVPHRVTAVIGGKSLESKLRVIDGLIEFVDEIYFVGEVAMSLYRVLHIKHMRNNANDCFYDTKPDEDEEELEDAESGNRGEASKEMAIEDEANEHGNEKGVSGQIRSPKGIWELLVPAVEKIQQKASRKCVQLLLPNDWIVGETPMEEQDFNAATNLEGNDDDDHDEDEEDEMDDDEVHEKKKRKRKASEFISAKLKPLIEPEHVDFFDRKKQGVYEGDRVHVVLSRTSSSKQVSPVQGWWTFQEITDQCLKSARVTEGKPSILHSLWPELDGEDAEEEGEDGATQRIHPARFEYEWTFRAFDVGPIAMEGLAKALKQGMSGIELDSPTANHPSSVPRVLIVNGVCGAVEFHEFSTATKQLLAILQNYNQSSYDFFIAGDSTVRWLKQLESERFYGQPGAPSDSISSYTLNASNSTDSLPSPGVVVDDRAKRNARVLKKLIAAKHHPIISNLVQ